MERVDIWFLSDNDRGRKMGKSIRELGLSCTLVEGTDFSACEIISGTINIFIVDIGGLTPEKVIASIQADTRLRNFLKFLVFGRQEIKTAIKASMNLLHVEILGRPLNKREFILLLEKSIVVERYREMMKYISRDAEERIETFESLMSINRREFLVTGREKEAFERILHHEKHLMQEQNQLNGAIRNFTDLRRREMFDMKDRIRAEEVLTELRRKELLDANSVIRAQESLIDFSAQELHQANRIIEAREKVEALSREEAIELHKKLRREMAKSEKLTEEVHRLRRQLKDRTSGKK
ncbi:MAG: hypothetical protein EPN93_08990 [Spirochaetes bacterium]|nr:MAG: hypothetical protein EPN93_08990 [Spirochaetota bacterium]